MKNIISVNVWHYLFLPLFLLFIFPMPSHATEEPDFKLVEKMNGIEIRDYAAYMVAEVVVDGPADQAGNRAFPILAAYIFGQNKGKRTLEMTALVTQTAEPVKPEKLAMTAPVIQTTTPAGFVVQFVLPKDITLANAPEPLDPRIKLRQVKPCRFAVIRYSGFWSDTNYNEHLLLLENALKSAKLAWEGEAIYSRYDPPFKPWFMRRNEIWLRLPQP
ncbi:heme-binding protein [Undibacterium jejuense]|uniref:Heme-binding protein n=1 Tax=Undibacterium jejuense TaxID=1344949 RepID=A0A923HGC1_9BURK|nr:heme-binding protein [Undibacterium jejuense]